MTRTLTLSSLLLLGMFSAAEVRAEAMTDRFIVRMKSSVQKQAASRNAQVQQALRAASAAGVGVTHWRRMGLGAEVVRLPRPVPLSQARQLAQQIAQQPGVDWAVPSQRRYPSAPPNDTQFSVKYTQEELTSMLGSASEAQQIIEDYGLVDHLWYMNAATTTGAPTSLSVGLNWLAAWERTTGFTNVNYSTVVAVVDTGILPHADIDPARILPGYDFISDAASARDGDGRDSDPTDRGDWSSGGSCEPSPSSWHGTFVAGIIAATANNGAGIAGVNPAARILPVRVLGECGGFDEDIIDGTLWAAGAALQNADRGGNVPNPNPADIINLSLGGFGECNQAYSSMVSAVRATGAVIVAASGNEAAEASNFAPANCAGVISVAATARAGALTDYSNFGPSIAISAPGGGSAFRVTSTSNTGTEGPMADTYVNERGTSFSAPMVAAAIGLVSKVNPALSQDELLLTLQQSASPFPQDAICTVDLCGPGIVDVDNAMKVAAVPVRANGVAYRFSMVEGRTIVTQQDVTLRNSGAAAVALGDIRVVSTVGEAGAFQISNGCGSEMAANVPGGCNIRVTYTPSASAVSSAHLIVPFASGELRLPLYGIKGLPVLSGPAETLNMFAVVGSFGDRMLTLTNISDTPLSFPLDAITLPANYTVDRFSCDEVPVAIVADCILLPEGQLTMRVVYRPTSEETAREVKLVVNPREGNAVTVNFKSTATKSGGSGGDGGGGGSGFEPRGGSGCTIGNGPVDLTLLLLPAVAALARRRRR